MKIYNLVRKNNYYDSVTLMLISQSLKQLAGIDDVSVMMGTAANRVILQDADLLAADGEAAGPNDLILAFRASGEIDVDEVYRKIDEQLKKKMPQNQQTAQGAVHSAVTAYQNNKNSNLAFISVPGEYAASEAERALKWGKNVFIFSDNISIEEEVQLKTIAAEKGLLVMGPDCGTAIINGKGIGFANKVRRGNIGIVAASGTGLQEVTCLLDGLGLGISQAIGTGGRDLKEAVGALTMLQGLDFLLADAATETIILISKPPAKSVADKILDKLIGANKRIIICFLGYAYENPPTGIAMASTLEEAVLKAAKQELNSEVLHSADVLMDWAKQARGSFAPQQKFVRALYAGGTLCYEAIFILGQRLGAIYSNIALSKEYRIQDVLVDGQHSAIDLGDDEFTMGRPHPMIDGSLRAQPIMKAARDPQTAVILLDVVIGYGASQDPAGELVPIIEKAKQAAKAIGNTLTIIAYICGTNQDEQHKEAQAAKLSAAGALVTKTNAEAARLASMIVGGLGDEFYA